MAQDETKTGQEIFDYVTSLVDRLNVSFVINSVNYLYKGGRCSGVAAVGATAGIRSIDETLDFMRRADAAKIKERKFYT